MPFCRRALRSSVLRAGFVAWRRNIAKFLVFLTDSSVLFELLVCLFQSVSAIGVVFLEADFFGLAECGVVASMLGFICSLVYF